MDIGIGRSVTVVLSNWGGFSESLGALMATLNTGNENNAVAPNRESEY